MKTCTNAGVAQSSALFLSAFFDELVRWGVRDVVVSPGSRSTPLSMVAYELSLRDPDKMRLFVDVDERGAAFFALGRAKATGCPAAVICTSGTAVANYYPAVLEAESSRVPLLLLTGDRPPRLQGLGAPQTCDQLKAFGDHVRRFQQMPLPAADEDSLAFARQIARESCLAAGMGCEPRISREPSAQGGAPEEEASQARDISLQTSDDLSQEALFRVAGACSGGPVHVNFSFDEPLKPDLNVPGLFEVGRRSVSSLHPVASTRCGLHSAAAAELAEMVREHTTLVLAGEGTGITREDMRDVLAWARQFDLPLLADPLSGLRTVDDAHIIDAHDALCGPDLPESYIPELIIRFGRFPVSKRTTQFVAASGALNVVVDAFATRDYSSRTDLFVPLAPLEFALAMQGAAPAGGEPSERQRAFSDRWKRANDEARRGIAAVDSIGESFEGTFVRRAIDGAPEGSCLFAANSMAIRAIDTFMPKSNKGLAVLCNRGLNGIDGTVSTALGAAQSFAQTTLIVGDLTMLHDLNALALQRELRVQRAMRENRAKQPVTAAETGGADAASAAGADPAVTIVLLNNDGGGIFDMLPQKSTDAYFERLFLTPQNVDFAAACAAFDVPYARAETVEAFDAAYRAAQGVAGISMIEVPVPLDGLSERYAPYWHGWRRESFGVNGSPAPRCGGGTHARP